MTAKAALKNSSCLSVWLGPCPKPGFESRLVLTDALYQTDGRKTGQTERQKHHQIKTKRRQAFCQNLHYVFYVLNFPVNDGHVS